MIFVINFDACKITFKFTATKNMFRSGNLYHSFGYIIFKLYYIHILISPQSYAFIILESQYINIIYSLEMIFVIKFDACKITFKFTATKTMFRSGNLYHSFGYIIFKLYYIHILILPQSYAFIILEFQYINMIYSIAARINLIWF